VAGNGNSRFGRFLDRIRRHAVDTIIRENEWMPLHPHLPQKTPTCGRDGPQFECEDSVVRATT